MNRDNLKEFKPEKYKDPEHVWDEVNEKSEFLFNLNQCMVFKITPQIFNLNKKFQHIDP